MKRSAAITSVKDGGSPTGLAISTRAPLDDRFRTMHSMLPPPPRNVIAPCLKTLCLGTTRFSIIAVNPKTLRMAVHSAEKLPTIESNTHRTWARVRISFTTMNSRRQHCERARDHRHRLVVGCAKERDAAETHGAPHANHARVGEYVGGGDGTHEMRGLIDRRHRTIAAIGGEVRQHHRGIGECHQRLAANNAAIPAQPFRKRHAQDCTRLPVSRSARRRGEIKPLDRQIEIPNPWRKHLAKHALCFTDAEFRGLWLLLHGCCFLARCCHPHILGDNQAKETAEPRSAAALARCFDGFS